eukprot:13634509-Alexandrium_andersonii.AAC.1
MAEKGSFARSFKAGTVNLCSIMKATMHHQIQSFMESAELDVLTLTETRAPGTTKYVVQDTLFLLSSSVEDGGRENAGVGIALSHRARKRVTFVLPCGSRLMAVRLRD